MVLEPETVSALYEMKLDGRTKEGKAQREQASKILVSDSDWKDCQAMASAVLNHPIASKLFSDGEAEKSAFAEIDGLNCKVRADYHKGKITIDLKSTDDASPEAFAKSALKYGYDMQAAMYSHVLESEAFVFVCVEKDAPFDVAVYVMDDAFLERGRKRMHEAISLYKQCELNNSWPGYTTDVSVLTLPEWSK
jgi:exodeoxyribonuclease VIII